MTDTRGPLEPDLDVAAGVRLDASDAAITGRPAVTRIFARPGLQIGHRCLADLVRDADLVGAVLRVCALPGSSRLKSVVCLPFCSKTTRIGFIAGASGAGW